MVQNKRVNIISQILIYLIMSIVALIYLIPFIIVVSASFSIESNLIKLGYGIFPKGWSLSAYRVIFAEPTQLFNAYKITLFTTAVGSVLGTLIMTLTAYPLSRLDYKWRKGVNFYLYFTMIFSGGAIPIYLLISQYLHLKNNILVLIIPMLMSPWNVFLLRTYFSKIPYSLIEAAGIDGAGEYRVFFQICLPLMKTGIATVFIMTAMGYWNEWYNCLMYMTNEKIITLQYFLYRVMANIDAITKSKNALAQSIDVSTMPSETVRMAMCVLATGPMIFIFAFFQKYFVHGLTLGSVKG